MIGMLEQKVIDMCLYPKLIDNPKYKANRKNGGVIPPLPNGDVRVKYVPIGCGKCMECMRKKKREWSVRLQEEVKDNRNGCFLTLTFSNENFEKLSNELWKLEGYELDNAVAKLGVKRFLGRWRKKYKKSARHWFVTELGHKGTENVHLHGFIWCSKEQAREIANIWQYGYVWNSATMNGYVNARTVNYCVKYIHKQDESHPNYQSIVLTSPGIGKGFIGSTNFKRAKYVPGKTRDVYITEKGIQMGLPIYYRNYLYSEDEREQLWIEKLDQQVRWVDGKEIDVSESLDLYYNYLEGARCKNTRLGFGSDAINWESRYYERQLRNLRHEQRRQKTIEQDEIQSLKDKIELLKKGTLEVDFLECAQSALVWGKKGKQLVTSFHIRKNDYIWEWLNKNR